MGTRRDEHTPLLWNSDEVDNREVSTNVVDANNA